MKSPDQITNIKNKNELVIDKKTLFKKDQNDNLIPEGSIGNLKDPWLATVNIIKSIYIEELGESLVSIYMYQVVLHEELQKKVSPI